MIAGFIFFVVVGIVSVILGAIFSYFFGPSGESFATGCLLFFFILGALATCGLTYLTFFW